VSDISKLLVFTDQDGPRLQYTAEILLCRLLGLSFELRPLSAFTASHLAPSLVYSQQPPSGITSQIWIAASGLVSQKTLSHSLHPTVKGKGVSAQLFPSTTPDALGFDIFSASFYLLSRYEEYNAAQRDRHGRFSASSSLAHRYEFLQLPIVQIWVRGLANQLHHYYPQLSVRHPQYNFQASYDIDLAWAFRHRGLGPNLLGMAADLTRGRPDRLLLRSRVLLRQQADPYDTYQRIAALHEAAEPPPLFFFLLGRWGRFDRNVAPQRPALRKLMRFLANAYPCGIHPSYRSNQQEQQLRRELIQYQAILGETPKRSRQHFLMLQLPDTYRSLLKYGIRSDYSMGYADGIGFRAGIAIPFPWYDLKAERQEQLLIHPFQVMDITLRKYLNLDTEEALIAVKTILSHCRKYGGTFTTLWHNSSFATSEGWHPWAALYHQVLADATS